MSENQFELELIQHLTTLNGLKQWTYEPSIKTIDGLWTNFKHILESLNKERLEKPLSITEFEQVKRAISQLGSPYKAGQFLYGHNGIAQVEVKLDEGGSTYLTVFDQRQIGAGNTIYQVVNQVSREAVQEGKKDRRFDVTLLMNGLPIIQIEAKSGTHDISEAFNQMKQYALEGQFTGIYSTLQILVGMSPVDAKYMANAPAQQFNPAFTFNWQNKENEIVHDWREFARQMLSIPMAHKMATNFMVLDGTKGKESLKVMRPYQVYATQEALRAIEGIDFETGMNRVGYIWHTTGSGKTITSFKTAWLASRMPGIDKVVFVVDRISLIRQTEDNYRAYDPDADINSMKHGSVQGTNSTHELRTKLKQNTSNIIITSTQKLEKLVRDKRFDSSKLDKNILFVVDEAHRSTGGEGFEQIQKSFKRASWLGYTGTPMFDKDDRSSTSTFDIFGHCLHSYTIREAISDRNVLGFKVDFKTTIPESELKEKYLPQLFANEHPNWTPEQIRAKVENMTPKDLDDEVHTTVYDNNEEHIRLVVADIFKHWKSRSCNGEYNALFTTKVGGQKASAPMALMYYDEFQRVNEVERQAGRKPLKVAVTFSYNTSNNDGMVEANDGLSNAIAQYNKDFGTNWDVRAPQEYTQDVADRLKRTATGEHLDILIVIDQMLTGFDAPLLNTLYVDRNLHGAGLIQAYSRTNRISNMDKKPWGRIVNYRYPALNEQAMNKALTLYANRNSANRNAMLEFEEDDISKNIEDGIISAPFESVLGSVKQVVDRLRLMTDGFKDLPKSELEQEAMGYKMKELTSGIERLKQYDSEETGLEYENPGALISALGMDESEYQRLTVVLVSKLKRVLSRLWEIEIPELNFELSHVKEIRVNYDYISALVRDLINSMHEGDMAKADQIHGQLVETAHGLGDEKKKNQLLEVSDAIRSGEYVHPVHPATEENSPNVMDIVITTVRNNHYLAFIHKWGILELVTSAKLEEMAKRHVIGMRDLNDTGELELLEKQAMSQYRGLLQGTPIGALSPIKYKNQLREALYELMDEQAQKY